MKKILLWSLFLSLMSLQVLAQQKSIAMIIAFDNFRDEELFTPKKIFENAGYKVEIFSWETGTAKGMLGGKVKVKYLLKDLNVDDFEAIVFVGGIGAQKYWYDEKALEIAKKAVERGKVVGAICIAPVILANAQVLEGKKATSWFSVRSMLMSRGAQYTNKGVETDGKIITAQGPQYAERFALKILEALK